MPIDFTILATTVVTTFLLPYAKKAAEKVADEVSKKVGESAAKYVLEVGGKVWNKVRSVFSSPNDQATFSQFEEYPDAGKELIIAILKKKLEENPQLAEELDKLVNSTAPGSSQSGAQIMSAGIAGIADLRGATLSGSGNKIAGVMFDHSTGETNSEPK